MTLRFFLQGAETALFLQHVCALEIWRWPAGAPSPQLQWRLGVASPDAPRGASAAQARASLALQRAALHGWARAELDAWDVEAVQHEEQQRRRSSGSHDGEVVEVGWRAQGASLALAQRLRRSGPHAPPRFTLRLRVTIEHWAANAASGHGAAAPDAVEEEEWWLRSGVGQGASWALAASPDAERADHALWPAATVAARVWRFVSRGNCNGGGGSGNRRLGAAGAGGGELAPLSTSHDDGDDEPRSLVRGSGRGHYDRRVAVAGHAFAALKLASLPTGWPVHVSARWALSDNRRDLVRCPRTLF